MNKEVVINRAKNIGKKVIIPAAIVGILSVTGCRGVEAEKVEIYGAKTPSAAAAEPTPITNNYFNMTLNQPEKTVTVTAPAPTVIIIEPTETRRPRPTETPKPIVTPEITQPDWTKQPVSSEIYVPNYGTTIDRSIGANQIGAISGGPMTIDYVDQYGYTRTLSFSGGSNRVTLAIFLGGQYYSKTIRVRDVVRQQNWVGIYNTPDQNSANQYNWQALMTSKVQETMTESSSIPGGAKFVDVVVIDGNNHLIYQNTLTR